MMLRSSSTPVLRSLLSSLSESPQKQHPACNVHQNCCKLSSNNGGFQNVAKTLSDSSSVPGIKGVQNGVRRAQSEGNLEGLDNNPCHLDVFPFSNQYSKKLAHKPTLEAIPSFSLRLDSEEEEEDEEIPVEGNFKALMVQNLASQMGRRNVDGCYGMGFVQDEGTMYLATGIGITAGGGSGGGSCRPVDFNRDGGDDRALSMEEHYKSMLEQSPGNPLFLRNYAHFLYQEKGDSEGAEEYYSRAILASPEDGEVLCEYAKLIWELYHNKEKAAAYFERAVHAASEDSHINASYASFLWDVEEDDDDDEDGNNFHLFHQGIMASATS